MAFEVNSYFELLVLQKVLFEAKFAKVPEVDELLASPLVGDMWLRVIRELQHIQPKNGIPDAAVGWENWLREKIKVGGREWSIALNRTKKDFLTPGWDLEKKKQFATEIFRPFILSDEHLYEFVRQAEEVKLSEAPMSTRFEEELVSEICKSILAENSMEPYLVDRIFDVAKYFKEEEKVYLEILCENIREFDLKMKEELKEHLMKLQSKYGVK
jgi:hypothetical protein